MPVDLLGMLSSEPAQWASETAVLDDAAKSELGAWLVHEWIVDLWRCHAPATVELVRQGSEWRACVDPHPQVERWICVDARTGALRLDSRGQDRAKAKGRHRAR